MEKKTECLIAVATGKTVPLSAVPDEVFAEGLLGEGIAIEPVEGRFFAPVSGKIESVTDSRHAVTILSDAGTDVLVHIGVDTVSLGGEGFVAHVSAGESVRAGDLIVQADIDLIRSRGLSAICSVVVTEPEKIENIEYKPGACIGGRDAVMSYQVTGRRSL